MGLSEPANIWIFLVGNFAAGAMVGAMVALVFRFINPLETRDNAKSDRE